MIKIGDPEKFPRLERIVITADMLLAPYLPFQFEVHMPDNEKAAMSLLSVIGEQFQALQRHFNSTEQQKCHERTIAQIARLAEAYDSDWDDPRDAEERIADLEDRGRSVGAGEVMTCSKCGFTFHGSDHVCPALGPGAFFDGEVSGNLFRVFNRLRILEEKVCDMERALLERIGTLERKK